MKIISTKPFLLRTDMELLLELLNHFEQQGIVTAHSLANYLKSLQIDSFTDLLNYTTGANCDEKLAIMVEELFDRLRLAEPRREMVLTSSKEVGTYLADKLAGHKQEEFWALYLDNGNHIIGEKLISQGTLNRSIAHPRDVFRWAVLMPCAGIIVAHNHPSGRLIPSQSDFKMTRDLQSAAEMMKIDLLDHFIVGKGCYLSMKEHDFF